LFHLDKFQKNNYIIVNDPMKGPTFPASILGMLQSNKVVSTRIW